MSILEENFIETKYMEDQDMEESIENSPEMNQLKERCKAHEIEFREGRDTGGLYRIIIYITAGRKKHEIRLYSLFHIRRLLAVPFERYHFLSDYFAISSFEHGQIEAELESLNRQDKKTNDFLFYQEEEMLGDYVPLVTWKFPKIFTCGKDNIKMSIGPLSHLGAFENSMPFQDSFLCRVNCMAPRISLKIEGLPMGSHDEAVNVLERVANSLFFQLDTALDVALKLKRRETQSPEETVIKRHLDGFELEYPKYEYDHVPMHLYWYARRAVEMPLLQFLAYYQVMEFYFPTYSQNEAIRHIRSILKDPSFRADSGTDIVRIVRALQTRSNWGFGTEESQLENTLRECLSQDDLREYLTAGENREKYFSKKQEKFVTELIPIHQKDADLTKHIAKRIYDIRCRIVHTKSDVGNGISNPILPFSEESKVLFHDINLVQYLARKVLINSSKPI